LTERLEILIKDKDSIFAKDDDLGSVTIPLDTIRKGVPLTDWYEVKKPVVVKPSAKGVIPSKFGQVRVTIKALDFDAVADTTAATTTIPQTKESTPASKPAKGTKGKINVRIIAAKDLMAADINGLSDPYVELTLGKSTSKSKTVTKTLNPTWDDTFEMSVSDPTDAVLKVEVYDKDSVFSKDELLGFINIPLSQLSKGVELCKWFSLNAPAKMPTGGPKTDKPPKTFGSINLGITALTFGSTPVPSTPAAPTPTQAKPTLAPTIPVPTQPITPLPTQPTPKPLPESFAAVTPVPVVPTTPSAPTPSIPITPIVTERKEEKKEETKREEKKEEAKKEITPTPSLVIPIVTTPVTPLIPSVQPAIPVTQPERVSPLAIPSMEKLFPKQTISMASIARKYLETSPVEDEINDSDEKWIPRTAEEIEMRKSMDAKLALAKSKPQLKNIQYDDSAPPWSWLVAGGVVVSALVSAEWIAPFLAI